MLRVSRPRRFTETPRRLAAAQREQRIARRTANRIITAGHTSLIDLERLARDEPELEQSTTDGGAGLVTEALRIVAYGWRRCAGALA